MKENKKPKINLTINLIRALSIMYIIGFWHLFNYTDAFFSYKNVITIRLTYIVLGVFYSAISGYFIGLK